MSEMRSEMRGGPSGGSFGGSGKGGSSQDLSGWGFALTVILVIAIICVILWIVF